MGEMTFSAIVGKVPAALVPRQICRLKWSGISLRAPIVTILWIWPAVWHNQNCIRKGFQVRPHDILGKPVSEDLELVQVGIVFVRSDVFSYAPYHSVSATPIQQAENSPPESNNGTDKYIFSKRCFLFVTELVEPMEIVIA
jgi:hypothetical protein